MELVKAVQEDNLLLAANIIKEANQESKDIALLESCIKGNLGIVKLLVENDINNLDITAFYGAICNGHFEIVKYLIEKCINMINLNESNNFKITPLYLASYCGYLEIVKLLIEKGAYFQKANDNKTPLYVACENGHLDIVKYLITQNETTTSKKELFRLSCLKENKEMVQFFLILDPMLAIEIQTGKIDQESIAEFFNKNYSTFCYRPRHNMFKALKSKKFTNCFIKIHK